jgi:hypothetical protein
VRRAGGTVREHHVRRSVVMSGEQRLIRPNKPAPRVRSEIDFGLIAFALLVTLAIAVGLACPNPEWTPIPSLMSP